MRVDRSLIPWLGDKTVRKRLRELDQKFTGLLVLIGIGFSKIFEGFVTIAIRELPIVIYGIEISSFVWWTIYTAILVFLFLTESDKKAREKAAEAGEKASEKASEKVEDVKESVESGDG